MFTIRDELGRAVGFSGRLLKPDEKGAGKYVNTPETPAFRKSRILFGLDKARRPIRDHRCVILCEGQIDCIRCHLGGFSNTVASQGTAITNEHATLLRRYADEVIIVLDADTAGQKAALRTAELMLAEGFAVQLAALPPGEDPDSLIVNQGPEAFAAVLEAALSPMNFLIGTLRAQPDWQTQAGLARATRAALELAGHAQSAVQAEQMLREAAAGLNVGFRSLQSDLRRIQRQKYRPTPATEPSAPPPPAVERPADELELAQLLGTHSDPELTGLVRQWLRYDLITDADCRAVIRAIAEEETTLWPRWTRKATCAKPLPPKSSTRRKNSGRGAGSGRPQGRAGFNCADLATPFGSPSSGIGAHTGACQRGETKRRFAGICRVASRPEESSRRLGAGASDY